MRHSGEVRSFDLRCIVHTRRDAVGNQIHQSRFFALGWVFQQLNQLAATALANGLAIVSDGEGVDVGGNVDVLLLLS